ncbi:hypothetical protein [Nocardia sp. SC052]|uniref:hypothetical protein n=1 Tax=Nocardia sichangensis TaxID=3385975 RepID=UPI0039A044F4
MRYRNRYDTNHHDISHRDVPHRSSHIHGPHDASTTADNYCGTTASGHAAIAHRSYPAVGYGRA